MLMRYWIGGTAFAPIICKIGIGNFIPASLSARAHVPLVEVCGHVPVPAISRRLQLRKQLQPVERVGSSLAAGVRSAVTGERSGYRPAGLDSQLSAINP